MMLGFVQSWMPVRSSPIGIDLGTRTIRLAQVEESGDEFRLVHADAVDVPAEANVSADLYRAFAIKAINASLRNGKFRGRRVALSLPQSALQVKHVRIERREETELSAQVAERAASAFDGSNAGELLVRHFIAGDIVAESGAQQETVLFAARRVDVQAFLSAAERARIDVVGVHVQPRVIVEAFGHFHRRKLDAEAVNLFVDLGGDSTRAVVADPTTIRFVRAASPGVDSIHTEIAKSLAMPMAEVAELRRITIAAQLVRSHDLPMADPAAAAEARERLERATAAESMRLADELEMCRRYHDATFPARPITRLIFCGGGARDRILCAAIAQHMSLPAQIGDPLVRFNRSLLPSLACLDRREPQPAWAAAIGLSLFGQTVAVT